MNIARQKQNNRRFFRPGESSARGFDTGAARFDSFSLSEAGLTSSETIVGDRDHSVLGVGADIVRIVLRYEGSCTCGEWMRRVTICWEKSQYSMSAFISFRR